MAYEKTFWPFIILTKKRYVGNKYEFDDKKYYQNSMGIVLKRRDNAPIVKIIVGGIVKSILNDKSSEKAAAFTKKTLRDILSAKYPLEKFIITKTLKGNALTKEEQKKEALKPKDKRSYSDRTRIVQAVLADRIAERDPGNKPASNDRIPYAYIITDGKVELQGDRVETPEYITQKNLQLDYLFYITNQIMKPSIQFLEHILNKPEDLFEQCIIKEMNRRMGKRPLGYYFNLKQSTNDESEISDEDDEDISDDDNSKINDFIERITSRAKNEDSGIKLDNDSSKKIIKPKQLTKNTKTKVVKKIVKKVSKPLQIYDDDSGGFVLEI
jgi:DNA polymerase elongation subunit (family B)